MRCRNSGTAYGGEDVEWTCTASLPPEFKLGSTNVRCEGYDSADDPYVLAGSCGVEYRLALTDAGEQKYGRKRRAGRGGSSPSEGSPFGGSAALLFWAAFLGVAGWIAYNAFRGAWARGPPRGAGGGPGARGGWGGDGGPDGPPPPYTPSSRKVPQSTYATQPTTAPQAQQPWRPGFLAGTGVGAAAGAAASAFFNNRNNNNRANAGRPSSFGTFAGDDGHYDPGEGPSTRRRASSPPRRSPPAPSTSRYESTGFGGTSRR